MVTTAGGLRNTCRMAPPSTENTTNRTVANFCRDEGRETVEAGVV